MREATFSHASFQTEGALHVAKCGSRNKDENAHHWQNKVLRRLLCQLFLLVTLLSKKITTIRCFHFLFKNHVIRNTLKK